MLFWIAVKYLVGLPCRNWWKNMYLQKKGQNKQEERNLMRGEMVFRPFFTWNEFLEKPYMDLVRRIKPLISSFKDISKIKLILFLVGPWNSLLGIAIKKICTDIGWLLKQVSNLKNKMWVTNKNVYKHFLIKDEAEQINN